MCSQTEIEMVVATNGGIWIRLMNYITIFISLGAIVLRQTYTRTHTYAIHSDERAIPALNVSINRILKKSKLDFELVIHSFRYLYIWMFRNEIWSLWSIILIPNPNLLLKASIELKFSLGRSRHSEVVSHSHTKTKWQWWWW